MYPGLHVRRHAWGLAVNLSSCTGCNACVVACQSENNIPTSARTRCGAAARCTGSASTATTRARPRTRAVHNQPVMCMHCEQAPCEVVCPVAATTHSEEGLNEMTYNRCIGTKYCSNNCPYKVRRFNFYDYNKDKHLPVLTLLANPNVTVRQKGVMEKCNYCIQRMNRARIDAEKENRPVRDGEILTACQQVCPTEALVFGDINDPASKVAKLKAEQLNYGLLEELNTRPTDDLPREAHEPRTPLFPEKTSDVRRTPNARPSSRPATRRRRSPTRSARSSSARRRGGGTSASRSRSSRCSSSSSRSRSCSS